MISTVLGNFSQANMTLSPNKRRAVHNSKILQKIQNDSLVYFRNCQQKFILQQPFFSSKEARLMKSLDHRTKQMFISINDLTSKWENIQTCQNEVALKMDSNQNKFYSILMEQSTLLTYSNVTFNSDQDKENNFSSSNSTPLSFSQKAANQVSVRAQKMEKILNEKLMQTYSRVINNMKKLDVVEKETLLDGKSPRMQKIRMIEKLINVMETNKNVRIREMFEERQLLSQSRENQKKEQQKKLQKVKEVEKKFKDRKIDEFTAIHELNSFRG